MIRVSVAPCVICGQGRPTYWRQALGLPYGLMRCPECGHVAVSDPQRNAERNLAIQLEAFDSAFAGRAGFFVALYENINSRRTTRSLRLYPGSKVLEVGPGSGWLMSYLAALGHDVTGLDLSPTVASAIRDRSGLRVVVGTLGQYVADQGSVRYDAIITRHTLEHIYEPVQALEDMYKLLKPAGKLYVAVPNMDSWHRLFSGWSGYELEHMHYFGSRSLSVALRRAGFRVVSSGSYESMAGWPNSLIRSIPALGRSIGTAFPSPSVTRQAHHIARIVVRNSLESVRCGFGLFL